LFDQGVPKQLSTTAPSSYLERHLTVFCIDEIVSGFVVYYLNESKSKGKSGKIAKITKLDSKLQD
jgi:hypothetical protein